MVRAHLLTRLLKHVWISDSSHPGRTAAGWILAAALSLTWAAFAGSQAGALADFWEVRTWLQKWDLGAANPYDAASLHVDYPPYAFFVLDPARAIPPELVHVLVPCISIALLVVAVWWLADWFLCLSEASHTRVELATFAAMALAGQSVRSTIVWGQSTPIALFLFAAALQLQRRGQSVGSGACLALASYKLNLAAGFGLMFLILGFWVPLVVAGAVVTLLTLMFVISVGVPLPDLVSTYVSGLISMYRYSDSLRGATGIRSVLTSAITDPRSAQILYVILTCGSLGATTWLAWKTRAARQMRPLAASASLLWCLMALPNGSYNAVLAFSAIWALSGAASSAPEASARGRLLLTAAVTFLVLPVAESPGIPIFTATPVASGVALSPETNANVLRIVIAGLFAAVLFRLATDGSDHRRLASHSVATVSTT